MKMSKMYQDILFVILILVDSIRTRIVIKESGLLPVYQGDLAMMFYMLVENSCVENLLIATAMKKCCEVFENGGLEDCSYIQLMGGHAGKIRSGTTKKITMLYPTLYPYNRNIICDVTLYYQSDGQLGGSIQRKITANTLLSHKSATIKDYVGSQQVKPCRTQDLDPLDNCEPVDCQERYHGKRGFFHRRLQICQPVDQCNQPNKALNIWINKCQDLNLITSPGDYELIANGPYRSKISFRICDYPYISNIRCVHGKMNTSTGFCKCNSGWGFSNDIIELNRYRPDTWPYYMCTHPEKSPYLLSFIITLIVVLIIISFIIWFLFW